MKVIAAKVRCRSLEAVGDAWMEEQLGGQSTVDAVGTED